MKQRQLVPFSLLVFIAAIISACASGTSIVTGTVRTPIPPERVHLYLDPPPQFETIGIVNASSDAGWSEQGSMNYAILELKRQAGKLGANGVLIVATGETTSSVVGGSSSSGFYAIPVTAKTVQGRAIFVDGGK